MIPALLATLALLGLALLPGATIYESVVMAPNYERDIPASIVIARQFLARTTPAHFFRPVTPLTQVLLLSRLVTALGLLPLLDAITFTFHYPRLAIMFKALLPEDPARLRRAAREWALGNLAKAALLVAAFLAALQAVTMLAAPYTD
jgi:hypothetical protein